MNEQGNRLAEEMKGLLAKRNHGIRSVTVEYGILCVYVRTKRALESVSRDLILSGGFQSVQPAADNISGGFIVHAVPR